MTMLSIFLYVWFYIFLHKGRIFTKAFQILLFFSNANIFVYFYVLPYGIPAIIYAMPYFPSSIYGTGI